MNVVMRGVAAAVLVVAVSGTQARAAAQVVAAQDTIALTLGEALDRALERSEEVRIARSQVDQARASVDVARSHLLPQVNTQLTYTRTLASVFEGGFEMPDSLQFEPDSTASVSERLSYLEQNTPNAAFGALGGLFGNLPFGREHTWNAGASLQQPLFAPAVVSGLQLANRAEEAARATYEESAAEVSLQVAEAYLGAKLAEQMAQIVEASVALAGQHLAQVRLQFDAGTASELDVLRAEVELENLRPQLAQASNARDLSVSNLKRLVNVPAETELVLTTSLTPGPDGVPADTTLVLPTLEAADAVLAQRASLRAARSNVAMMEERADIARSSFLPSLYLQGNMSRQAFPSGVFPSANDWRDDWYVALAVSWPLFQGMRRKAELDAAKAQVRQAELQTAQLEEGVRLEYDAALRELERARLQMQAAGSTVAQAQRVYELTELRFREGLATQLDVSDARLSLQQARLNEVTAYHDYSLALAQALRALGRPAGELVAR